MANPTIPTQVDLQQSRLEEELPGQVLLVNSPNVLNRKAKKLKIGHLNVRSLFTGFDEFQSLVLNNDLDIVGVTETWLSDNIVSDIVGIDGFKFYRKDRARTGGGVGVYVRDWIHAEVVNDYIIGDGVEIICIKVKIKKNSYFVAVAYRIPSANLGACIEYFDDLLASITPLYDDIFVLGDLNVDLLNSNQLENCFSAYDFKQLINEPTRVTQFSSTLIDVIFTNKLDDIIDSGVINADLVSDHSLIYCTLNLNVSYKIPKFITYRNFKTFSYDKFSADLSQMPWDNILYINDINEKVIFLNNFILLLFDKHAPLKTSFISKPYAPWLTPHIKDLMRERNKALSKFKKSKTMEDWLNYKQLRNWTVSTIRREKTAYLNHIDVNRNTKQLWKSLNHFNVKQNKKKPIDLSLFNANDINDYFLSVFSQPNNCVQAVSELRGKKFTDSTFTFNLASCEDIFKIVNNLKSNAMGHDGISAKMLKLCCPTICKYITHIVNSCLERGYYPETWKLSLIRPLPKTNDVKTTADLRPISILPVLSKVLEKFILKQVYEYICTEKIIPDNQSGFRAGHSTTTVLTKILDDCLKSQDEGKLSLLVSLDFSKAFDKIDHALLCSKLVYYGFDNTSTLFFQSYLQNRFQQVELGEYRSDIGLVTSGVPQGAILAPPLFTIYTAELLSKTAYADIGAFADDTHLVHHFSPKDIHMECERLSQDLNSIYDCSNKMNLKLNSDKCNVIYFSPNRYKNLLKTEIKLTINNNFPLSVAEKIKNLGLIIDNDFRFKSHVSSVIKKCYVALKILYSNHLILNFKLRKKLCELLVMPFIYYCFVIYYPCLDSVDKYRLQKIQNNCCRFIFNLRKYDHVSDKILELKWLKVDKLFVYHFATFVYRLFLTSEPAYLRIKFHCRRSTHNANIDLRNVEQLSMPKFRTTLYQRSFVYNTVKIYNRLYELFKTSKSVNGFKKMVRSSLFENK